MVKAPLPVLFGPQLRSRTPDRESTSPPRAGTRLAAGVPPRDLRSLPSREVPRKMPADPLVVFSDGIVTETPQGLTVILGRARAGDEHARGVLIALIISAA